jgi:hypothetical protein
MKRVGITIIILAITTIVFSGNNAARTTPNHSITDISWPNCDVKISKADSGIVGIGGGLALRPNPCLAREAANFKHLSVYVNTGYPGGKYVLKYQNFPKYCRHDDNKCLAYNYGYNSGLYDIKYSLIQGIIAKKWWLDVETVNSWSNNYETNRQTLVGTLDAINAFAAQQNVGFYSAGPQWNSLTGRWRNGYPAWLATGATLETDAKAACKAKSFTGGPIQLTQYTPRLDENYICT